MTRIVEKIKKYKNKIIKIFMILFGISFTIFIIFLILIILSLFGIVDNYVYLKINDNNRHEITALIKQQEDKMFGKSIKGSFDSCYKNLFRIEVIHLFPDGEDYTMYCGNEKIEFSIDSSNYDLPEYIGKNGHQWFRIR